MNQQTQLPEQKIIDKTVNNLRSVCHQLDVLTLELDELIVMVEADIRNSPINIYRRKKAQEIVDNLPEK
jgi:hypothetical protein